MEIESATVTVVIAIRHKAEDCHHADLVQARSAS
jgi:hypothetical protein